MTTVHQPAQPELVLAIGRKSELEAGMSSQSLIILVVVVIVVLILAGYIVI